MVYNEVEVLKYVENSLTPKQRINFEQKMEQDTELKKLVQAMKASVLPYEAALSELEPEGAKAPESLYDFLDDVSRAVNEEAEIKRSLKLPISIVAALAVVVFVAGFMTSTFIKPHTDQSMMLASYDVPVELFESMVIYQALYSRKTVEAAYQTMEDAKALVDTFSHENGIVLSVPDLSKHGYTFRRVQELAYGGNPILQFVYLAENGEPVAVCITPANTSSVAQLKTMPSQFANMNTVLWGRSGGAYMLISKEPQDKLNQMAVNLVAQSS